MKIVITTVGTSIFTNYRKQNSDIIDKIDDLERKPYSQWDYYKDDINSIKKSVSGWAKNNNSASAETKSLFAIQEEIKDNIEVYLLVTDTVLSHLAAEIIKEFFETKENVAIKNIEIIEKLQVSNRETFEKEGLVNLVNIIHNIIQEKHYENIILNITGGYKAIIPYMTIMGQINNIPIYYIFEDTNELIEIPQTPIDFDFSVIDENYIAFKSLRRKNENLPLCNDFKMDLEKNEEKREEEFNRLKKGNLIKETEEKVALTLLGKLLMQKYEELFNSGKYHKQNLISNLIELKLFKYFVKNYENKANVKHGKKLGKENYDIDIYIENKEKVTAIEVKSGGNVPIWEDKAKRESIEYKLKEGGFKFLMNNLSGKKLELEVILYHSRNIHRNVICQINRLHEKLPEETKFLKWYWLKICPNYASNVHWDINVEDILEINLNQEVKNV